LYFAEPLDLSRLATIYRNRCSGFLNIQTHWTMPFDQSTPAEKCYLTKKDLGSSLLDPEMLKDNGVRRGALGVGSGIHKEAKNCLDFSPR